MTRPSAVARWLDGAVFLLLLTCLGLRCTRGLDLSDEMQYYGQIVALTSSGHLFASDLFVQQLVYVPFYPFFKLHELLFQQEGLVLFGRILLALLLAAMFVFVRRWLIAQGAGRLQAALAALALTFAIPYHGIFAISYNTISQLTWALFLIQFWDWNKRSMVRFALLLALTGVAHPAAGLVMGGLVAVRMLWQRRLHEFLAWMGWCVALGALVVGALSLFTTTSELVQSLRFSRGFAVGVSLFADPAQWQVAAAFVIGLLVITWLPRGVLAWLPVSWLLLSYCLFDTWMLFKAQTYNGYTAAIMQAGGWLVAMSLVTLRADIGSRALSSPDGLRWLTLGVCAHFLTLVVTSSNGLGQGTGAVLVALPLLVGVRLPSSSDRALVARFEAPTWLVTMAVLATVITLWSTCPYRDGRWNRVHAQISGVPAFRFIRTSNQHLDLINAFQQQLGAQMKGQPALIVSEYPALYFALNAVPQTCMLYMHSIGSSGSVDALSQCLKQRHPAVLLDVYPEWAHAKQGSPVKLFARQYAQDHHMHCLDRGFDSIAGYDKLGGHLNYRLCRQAGSN